MARRVAGDSTRGQPGKWILLVWFVFTAAVASLQGPLREQPLTQVVQARLRDAIATLRGR